MVLLSFGSLLKVVLLLKLFLETDKKFLKFHRFVVRIRAGFLILQMITISLRVILNFLLRLLLLP